MKKVHCHHRELSTGDKCQAPDCQGCLWPVNRLHHFVQFTGEPNHDRDALSTGRAHKCANCEKEYEAPLPAGVKPQRWDEKADTAIVIQMAESEREGWLYHPRNTEERIRNCELTCEFK